MGHADDRIAVFELLPAAQVKGIPARRDGNALSVGKFAEEQASGKDACSDLVYA